MSDDDTTPRVTLHAYLGYRDAEAAIDWLGQVLGFDATMVWPGEDGGIQHAELRLGDAAITLWTDRDGYERSPRKGDTSGLGLYLAVADNAVVDAVHERAQGTGATVVWAPQATEWGNYRCRLVDPQGVEWTVGTHRPGEPAGEW